MLENAKLSQLNVRTHVLKVSNWAEIT